LNLSINKNKLIKTCIEICYLYVKHDTSQSWPVLFMYLLFFHGEKGLAYLLDKFCLAEGPVMICLSVFVLACTFVCVCVCLSIVHLSMCLSMSVNLSNLYPCICLSIHPFICLSVRPSIHPSVYSSIHLFVIPSFCTFVYLSI